LAILNTFDFLCSFLNNYKMNFNSNNNYGDLPPILPAKINMPPTPSEPTKTDENRPKINLGKNLPNILTAVFLVITLIGSVYLVQNRHLLFDQKAASCTPPAGKIGYDGPGGCCGSFISQEGESCDSGSCRDWESCSISNGDCASGTSCQDNSGSSSGSGSCAPTKSYTQSSACDRGSSASVTLTACIPEGCALTGANVPYSSAIAFCDGEDRANCDGACGAAEQPNTLTIPSGERCNSVTLSCNPRNNCGTCQVDIDSHGSRRWENVGCYPSSCTAYIQGRVASGVAGGDCPYAPYWRGGSCAGCTGYCNISSGMRVVCNGVEANWGCNGCGALFSTTDVFKEGEPVTCVLTGLPAGYECTTPNCTVIETVGCDNNDIRFFIRPKPTSTPLPTPTSTPKPTNTPTPMPTNMPTPTSKPTSTPIPTPTPSAVCEYCHVYNLSWETIQNLSSLSIGDEIYLATKGSTTSTQDLTKAKFKVTIDGVASDWMETSQKHNDEFYLPYTILKAGIYTIESMVYHPQLGWK
jgi:hypothetical protein